MSDLETREEPTLAHILPPQVKRKFDEIPPDFFDMTEAELSHHLPTGQFTVQDKRLRISFWQEYNRCAAELNQMNVNSIVRGVCSRRHFLERVCCDPIRLAFILTPPSDYKLALEESLDTLVGKMREIADLPVTDKDGQPNYKNIAVVMKAFEHVDNRIKGAAVQRIESKSVSLNATAAPKTVQDIDRRLQELESQTVTALPSPGVDNVRIGAIVVPTVEATDVEKDS